MSVFSLTIRKRIYGGAAMLVALSVGLVIVAINQSTTNERQVVRLGLLSDNNNIRVLQIDRDLESIRRTLRSYKAAAGDTDVAVPSRDATDEMGAMAKAIDVFKENTIERRKLEEAQRQRDANAAVEKQQAMAALANTFEDAVSEIIETVSSSATELEAPANTLTATATRSEEATTTVAAASEEASTTVRSVAAATGQLTSSVHELARSVQQAAQGTQQVTVNITDVQRGTVETGSASSQVLSAARSLSRDSNRLKTELGKFLHTVQAAA